jgi:hypothetical protein
VLAGSIVEALLLWALQNKKTTGASTRKYRFARPPRSCVGSPTQDDNPSAPAAQGSYRQRRTTHRGRSAPLSLAGSGRRRRSPESEAARRTTSSKRPSRSLPSMRS